MHFEKLPKKQCPVRCCSGLSQSALLFYNNVLALPVMTSFMLTTTNELRDVAVFPQIHEPSFQVRFCLSGGWHPRYR